MSILKCNLKNIYNALVTIFFIFANTFVVIFDVTAVFVALNAFT